MKVVVRKYPNGRRGYRCERTIGNNTVAHRFHLLDGQKVTEADILGAQDALNFKLRVQMRLLGGQVNPGEDG